MSLIRLVYISAATQQPSDQDLKRLLEGARERNKHSHITGFLVYKNRTFMQVLEGESDVVHQLLAKIKADSRNNGLVKLLEQPIEKRDFASWYMGFENLEHYTEEQLPAYVEILDDKIDDSKIEAVKGKSLNLLLSFVKQADI
jgi:hypothetical protein